MSKYNYLTDDEAKMPTEFVDAQILLGLKTCKTGKDVKDLLQDVRTHERQLNKTQTSFGETDLEILEPMLKEITKDNARFILGIETKKDKIIMIHTSNPTKALKNALKNKLEVEL